MQSVDDDWSLDDVVIPDHPCPPARCSLEDWYAEAATLEHLDFKPLWMRELAQWQARNPQMPNAGQEVVIRLGRAGYSFDRIAELFGCDVEDVVRPLTKSEDYIPRLLAVERCWRANPTATITLIAKLTGESPPFISRLIVSALGHVFPRTAKLNEGAGVKYGVEVYDQIKTFRHQGMSYGDIARRLNMSAAVVAKICHRQGFKKRDAKPGHGICTICRDEKPASEFFPSRSTPTGLHYYCKPCQRAKHRERRARRVA
jgi:hypothetical protein